MGGFGQFLPSLVGGRKLTPEELEELRRRSQFQDPIAGFLGESAERMTSGARSMWEPSGTTAADPRFWEKKAQGAADVMAGSAPFTAPLMLPAVAAGLAEAPLATLAGIVGGTAVGEGTTALAEKAGMPPGMASLAGVGAGGVTGLLGAEVGPAALAAYKESPFASERGSWSWKPGTKLAQIPEEVEIPRAGKRLTIHDLGAYFNERMGKTLGQIPADAPPSRKLNRILKVAIPEFEDQLQQPDPKLDFYTTDTPQADRDIKQAYPELKTNPSKFIIQKAMSANFSPGSEPIDEAYNGARAYDIYKRTGKVPLTQASGVGWQGYNAAATMARLQKYIDYFGGGEKGEKALVKFITTKHTIREMQQVNPNVYGTKAMQNDIVHGSLIFGPKVGEYFDDIMGIKRASSTIDQWEVRANHRRLGDTLRNGKLIDVPLTNSDREVFKELHHILADRYKLTRNQAQSGTWHYEKGLYTRLGVPSPPTGRSDGTLRALEEMGQSRPPNPKAKPTQLNLRQLQVKPSGPLQP